MFNGELLEMLAPDLDFRTLEKISLGGVGGAAAGYVTHIEIGVNDTFFLFLRSFRLSFHLMSLAALPDSWVFSMHSKSSLTERAEKFILPNTHFNAVNHQKGD